MSLNSGIKLSEVISSKDNNFNIIRMLAAILVIFSHSFALSTGIVEAEPIKNYLGISLGYIAVDVFFVTSGLLVYKSLCTSKSLGVFIASRCLRIYPALIIVVLFCCLLGFIISDLSLYQYITNPEFIQFIFYNGTIILTDYQELPGVFLNAPLDRSVNGSLWTLPWELRMYTILAGLGVLIYIFRKTNLPKSWPSLIIILIALTSLALYLYHYINDTEYHWFYTKLYRFTAMFFIGGSLYVLKDHLQLKTLWMIIAITTLAFASYLNKEIFFISYVILTPYIVLCLAYIPKGKILNYNKLGDFSYGMYIYAWPVQQTLAVVIIGISPLSMFLLAFLITFLLSYISWNYIEKPSLNMKRHLIKS